MKRPVTLLFFDLNDFKQINDLYGHAEGDHALKTFADVLRIAFRESDVVGRLGGDEFVALLTGTSHVETAAIMARLEKFLLSAMPPWTAVMRFASVSARLNMIRRAMSRWIGCWRMRMARCMRTNKP